MSSRVVCALVLMFAVLSACDDEPQPQLEVADEVDAVEDIDAQDLEQFDQVDDSEATDSPEEQDQSDADELDLADTDTADTEGLDELEQDDELDQDPDAVCEPECPLGAARCHEDGGTQLCEDLGAGCTRWSAPQDCAPGKSCVGGYCVTSCSESETRCLNAFELQSCIEGQLSLQTCLFGCDALNAQCLPCQNGAMRCEATTMSTMLEQCVNGVWQVLQPCPSCACSDGMAVRMQCLGSDEVSTACSSCTPDAAACLP